MKTDEFYKELLKLAKPLVKSISSVSVKKKFDVLRGQEDYDVTIFYTTKKGRKTNTTWFLFANDFDRIKTLEGLLTKVKENLSQI